MFERSQYLQRPFFKLSRNLINLCHSVVSGFLDDPEEEVKKEVAAYKQAKNF